MAKLECTVFSHPIPSQGSVLMLLNPLLSPGIAAHSGVTLKELLSSSGLSFPFCELRGEPGPPKELLWLWFHPWAPWVQLFYYSLISSLGILPSALPTPPLLFEFNYLLPVFSDSLLPPASPPPFPFLLPLLFSGVKPSPAVCSPVPHPPPGLLPCYSLPPPSNSCLLCLCQAAPPKHSPD